MLLFWILLTVVVCFFLYLYMIMPNTSRRSKILPYLKRDYAHRGLHDSSRLIPENSMPAFRVPPRKGSGRGNKRCSDSCTPCFSPLAACRRHRRRTPRYGCASPAACRCHYPHTSGAIVIRRSDTRPSYPATTRRENRRSCRSTSPYAHRLLADQRLVGRTLDKRWYPLPTPQRMIRPIRLIAPETTHDETM